MIILNGIGMIAFLYLTFYILNVINNKGNALEWAHIPTFMVMMFTLIGWMIHSLYWVLDGCS